jgi:hypothetical protein
MPVFQMTTLLSSSETLTLRAGSAKRHQRQSTSPAVGGGPCGRQDAQPSTVGREAAGGDLVFVSFEHVEPRGRLEVVDDPIAAAGGRLASDFKVGQSRALATDTAPSSVPTPSFWLLPWNATEGKLGREDSLSQLQAALGPMNASRTHEWTSDSRMTVAVE